MQTQDVDVDLDAVVGVDDVDSDDDTIVLPWWRNPITIVALLVALVTFSGGIGYVVGTNTALDDPNETDIGFLQDMRFHHEQALAISLAYLNDSDIDRGLRNVASTVLLEQQLEIGRMIQMLRGFGESEVNETDVAMSWMGHEVPLESMPGLATEEDLERLRAANGADADRIFAELMTVHHLAGIDMAQHAVEHAAVAEVRTMARQIVVGQSHEVEEIAGLLERAETDA